MKDQPDRPETTPLSGFAELVAENARLRTVLRDISHRTRGDEFHMAQDIHSMCALVLP